MMKESVKIHILDCTIRDGGYVNNWQFDKTMVRETYRALSKSGVDFAEIGFRGTAKHFDPKIYGHWRFTTEEMLQEITNGIEGCKISIMGDYGKIDLEDFENRDNSMVDMVRIAVHKDNVFNAIGMLEKLKGKGYLVSLQAMGFTGYTEEEKSQLRKALKQSALDYFYIADSYGSIIPEEIEALFEPFQELETVKLGFHPHNSLQMAFANTLEAIKIGVNIVDASIYGMGRGAGNLPTEVLLAYLVVRGNRKYNVIPILNTVDRYFIDIMKDTPWGYQLPYMISGMFKCHPYYAAELVKRREYSIDDVWRVLEIIEEMNPTGFDQNIIDSLIKKGAVSVLNEVKSDEEFHQVPYIDRHAGKDFLILANGPTLKNCRDRIQAFIEKYDPVVCGANYLAGFFEPQYHAFNSKKRFVEYVKSVSSRSKLLVGENITKDMISDYASGEYETLYFRDTLDADFDIKDGRIQANCRTISVLLIALAIVMGAKRIFVAGMDGYLDKKVMKQSLFYDEKVEIDDHKLRIERHKWNERFLRQINDYFERMGREGIHIITPTSHSSFYKSIENYL